MRYMQVSGNEQNLARCSDNSCPCGLPGAGIPRGEGYVYVSKEIADFRADCLNEAETRLKVDLLSTQTGTAISAAGGVFAPILMCEQGARKRGLDLSVAAADAQHWWKTGLVPLRPTPLAGAGTSSDDAAARHAVAPSHLPDSSSQPSVVPQTATLRGFPKGWAIVWIVVNIAGVLAPMSDLSDSAVPGLIFFTMLLNTVAATGYFLLVKKRAIGLYAVLGANLVGFLIGIVQVPGYYITVKTGLIPGIITYFITRKQIRYPFGRSRVN